MLCYQKITSNQAIEIRTVREKEFDPFAKTICQTKDIVKRRKKNAIRKSYFTKQKLLTNIKPSSGQRK